MTGPSGTMTLGNPLGVKGVFNAVLPASAIPSTGGTYTFKGAGGADVGILTSTLTLANPLLIWTNDSAAATIDRTRDSVHLERREPRLVRRGRWQCDVILRRTGGVSSAWLWRMHINSLCLPMSYSASLRGRGGAMVQNSVQSSPYGNRVGHSV